jgi:hypothetical protein
MNVWMFFKCRIRCNCQWNLNYYSSEIYSKIRRLLRHQPEPIRKAKPTEIVSSDKIEGNGGKNETASNDTYFRRTERTKKESHRRIFPFKLRMTFYRFFCLYGHDFSIRSEKVNHFTIFGNVKLNIFSSGVPYADKSNIRRWKSTGRNDKRDT